MSGKFDIDKLLKLANEKKPKMVFVIDTNVIINNSNFSTWKAPPDTTVIYLVLDVLTIELEWLLKRKNPHNKPDNKFIEVKNQIANLYGKGNIRDGIYLENVGWFIGLSSPILSKEMEEYKPIVDVFGKNDLKLFLLTKTVYEAGLPVVFMTNDTNLFNIIKHQEVPTQIFNGFPITLETHIWHQILPQIEWDKVLENIQKEIKLRSVTVELTLTNKRTIPLGYMSLVENPRPDVPLLVAEGHGEINTFRFEWSLPFYEWNHFNPTSLAGSPLVDFGKNTNKTPKELIKQISEQLQLITYPSHNPTVQNTVSVMEHFFSTSYNASAFYFEDTESEDACYKRMGDLESFGVETMRRMLSAYWEDEGDSTWLQVKELIQSLKCVWNVGEVKTVRVLL